MMISERKEKISSSVRFASVLAIVSAFAVVTFFDIFGMGTLFKWIVYVVGALGVLLGGYLVYLRTKDNN